MMGIDIRSLPNIRSVSYRFLSKTYHGVGVINQNNGIEFINYDLLGTPVTLNKPGITLLPMKKERKSNRLCVFFDLADYFAYQTLQNNGYVRLPEDCDAVIMSDVRNIIHVTIEGDDYNTVFLYFPNDVTGSTITRTLKDRYGDHAVVCNPLYKGYDNLLQFVRAIEHTTNNKTITV
uniref:Uncharacterized protein n=1 Tax=Prevotella sp. GTC17254 TaxID=3236794 RepID=A0AB33J2F3_9BACT